MTNRDWHPLGFVAAVGAVALCCASGLLVSAGALGVLGAFTRRPEIVLLGLVLVTIVLVIAARRLLGSKERATATPDDPGRRLQDGDQT